jgi:hypothetical protein
VGENFQAFSIRFRRDRPDKRGIRPGRHWALDREANVAAGFTALKFPRDPGSLGTEVDRAEVNLGSRYARNVQQFVDKRGHLHAALNDFLRISPALLAEGVSVLLKQRLAKTAQRPQRGAQVAGNRIAEHLQVLVGALEILYMLAVAYVADGGGDEKALVGTHGGQ